MRSRFLRLALSTAVSLFFASATQAEPIPFSGTLEVQLGSLPSLTAAGTGSATVNGSGGLGHLTTLALTGGGVGGTATLPLTDPANPTLVSLIGTFNLGTGTFTNISGGGPGGGPIAVGGLFRLCIITGPGCPVAIEIPMTVNNGATGVGVGGLITISGFAKTGVRISIVANPWTVGTAVITGLPTDNGGFSTASRFGFAHGPASATSSTANPSGVVQLVTPTLVQTSIAGSETLALFSVLTIHFTPEPGTLLLVGAGLVGLAIAGRARRR